MVVKIARVDSVRISEELIFVIGVVRREFGYSLDMSGSGAVDEVHKSMMTTRGN